MHSVRKIVKKIADSIADAVLCICTPAMDAYDRRVANNDLWGVVNAAITDLGGSAEYDLHRNANPNLKRGGFTVLMKAAEHGHVAVVGKLLERGANVHAKDKNGCTALMKAAEYGRAAVVEKLLERGANVHAKDKNGCTALMKAAERCPEHQHGRRYDYTAVVEKLLKKGANVNEKDKKGCTARDYATNRELQQKLEGGGQGNVQGNVRAVATVFAASKAWQHITGERGGARRVVPSETTRTSALPQARTSAEIMAARAQGGATGWSNGI